MLHRIHQLSIVGRLGRVPFDIRVRGCFYIQGTNSLLDIHDVIELRVDGGITWSAVTVVVAVRLLQKIFPFSFRLTISSISPRSMLSNSAILSPIHIIDWG